MSDTPVLGLDQLQELALPAPPAYWPQTWGWAVVAVLLLLGIGWMAVWGYRRHRRNLYRRQALRALEQLNREIAANPLAIRELPGLLKRTALAAQLDGQRTRVAALHGDGWLNYLQESAGQPVLPDGSGRVLLALAYAPDETVRSLDGETLKGLIAASRLWMERHHVAA
ncbi:DUF4381 domain-containing protein [Bordetella tumbae]|uniref:DUF4381 domain-containing protein n=1 Tax=Bordetella tumbae TaxID=1649139 RepID=UPI0039F0F73F